MARVWSPWHKGELQMTPKEIALAAVKALDSKKGQDIKMLETGHLTPLADYCVLGSATSTTQC